MATTVQTTVDDDRRNWTTETWTTTAADNISSTGVEFDVDVYLEQHLGYRHRSAVESFSLTAVYLLILMTGVVGNVITCVVIVRNSYMHTATNCYLFSLAISDTFQLVLGTSTLLSLCSRTASMFTLYNTNMTIILLKK